MKKIIFSAALIASAITVKSQTTWQPPTLVNPYHVYIENGSSTQCVENSIPWYEGGNIVITGQSIVGPCNDRDFTLQAAGRHFVFITQQGNVGVGENNSNPSTILDVSNHNTGNNPSGGRYHTNIYGDEDGAIESTANMHLYADPNYQFQLSFGTQAGNGSSNNTDVLSIDPAATNILNDAFFWGNTSVSGILKATGNFSVGTNKFRVTASNGNTEVGGTFNTIGNLSVNTNKFSVANSNGKTNIGNASGATNLAQLNVNVTGASGAPVNAIDVYDGYTWQHNFSVNSEGKMHLGNPNVPQGVNSSKLNINVAGSSTTPMNALEVYDGGHTGAVNFLVKSNGYVYAREVNVQSTPFPDYVFDKNYKLLSLGELEQYIKQNKHLPNVPTAAEVETNGVNVSELLKVQMEKIEELTLYVIELKKELERLKDKEQKH